MRGSLDYYLDHRIPFALFRAPGKEIRFVAQTTPTTSNTDYNSVGFHFAPFSSQEKVPHVIIKNDIDIVVEGGMTLKLPKPSVSPPRYQKANEVSRTVSVDFPTYKEHIKGFLSFFEKNDTQKAIYSRIKKSELPDDFELISFFQKLERAYLKAFIYVVHLPDGTLWVGASPEKLLHYKNGRAQTVALAGTQKIAEHEAIEELEWGAKEIEEHGMVVDYIEQKIKSSGLLITKETEVYTSKAGTIAHLKKQFEFQIAKEQLSGFLTKLHPTPAVCGLPKEKALGLIYATEPYDRQYYAGYLGMVEANDEVNFYVNLRCMKIFEKQAMLFVGGGITTNSSPEKEWVETELKAKTLLNVLDLIEV